ncbi:MAG: bifunctional heptose 7-phosphate kinase/heptose 1-phosphate adenyltransferase [Alphaproteobacteria bacterium]|nr:bifunctional heptose 7-phosphate kinase/heptose 1-phosphate adenyltransferase [Alphaproteobacteria bacterium]
MSELSEYIKNFQNVRMLIIGDVMLDEFIYGKVERISPEAPVPVIRLKSEKKMLGGAGNVALNAAALKVNTSFIGLIGNDEAGLTVNKLFEETSINKHLFKLKDYPTIIKKRYIAGNAQLLRADKEEKFPDVAGIIDRLEKIFVKFLKKADVILLSDYNKGTLTKEVCQMVIKNANQEGIKVIVDPKGPNYTKYNGAFLVKPNLKEFSESTGVKFNTESPLFKEELKEAAKIFFAKYQVQNLVVTLSEKGMACFSREYINNMVHVPTIAKEVFDVSGAGDTSLAVLGAAFALNTPQIAALTLANTASGIAVSKLGTASVTPEELTEALNEAEKNTPSSGVITLEQAVKIRENLRKVGKTVGFTNGCFDCLHLGHLHSFNEAKKECDILFVGINSDTSVKRLKGPARPLQDEQTRAGLLSALKMINYVIIFDEDTALPLIEALKPDVIAKEGYALKDWPEAQLVIKQGGRAVTLKRLEGYSTTSMVERMKNYD